MLPYPCFLAFPHVGTARGKNRNPVFQSSEICQWQFALAHTQSEAAEETTAESKSGA